jgi:hypothetical protein
VTFYGGMDPYIGKCRITYALWSVMGEALEDYFFGWEWKQGSLTLQAEGLPSVTTVQLEKYPDLKAQFYALKPGGVEIGALITIDGHKGSKTLQPDLIPNAGVAEVYHVTGSPPWERFFDVGAGANGNKRLFINCRDVRLFRPCPRGMRVLCSLMDLAHVALRKVVIFTREGQIVPL